MNQLSQILYETNLNTTLRTNEWAISIKQTGMQWASGMITYTLSLLEGEWPEEDQLKWLICNRDVVKINQPVQNHDPMCQPASFWFQPEGLNRINVIMKV